MEEAVKHTILGIISLIPCSGYDLKAEAEKGSMGMLSALSFGSIYPHLKQLEQEGLIETQQIGNDGRRKKVYELTASGWHALTHWLEQTPIYPLPIRDEMLLRMIFWGSTGADRSKLIAHLQTRREESTEVLTFLVEWQNNEAAFIDEYGMLVLTFMKSRLEAEIAWIAVAIAQLEGPPQLPVQDSKWLAVLQKARRTKALQTDAVSDAQDIPLE